MKKILFISIDNPFLRRTGGQVFDYSTIMRFSKLCEIHVATVSAEKIDNENPNITIHYLSRRFEKISSIKGKIQFFYQLFFNRLPRASAIVYDVNNIKFLQDVINSNQIDLVIFNHLESVVFRKLNIKNKLIIHHNYESKLFRSISKNEKSLLKKIFYRLESIKYQSLESSLKYYKINNFFLSSDEIEELGGEIGQCCELFPVLINKFTYQYHEKNYIYMFGNWDYLPSRQGLEYILKFLEDSDSNVQFKISGYCSSRDFVKSLNDNKCVDYLGFIEKEEVANLLRNSKVTIIPIFSGAGVKIKLVEALENGACIVTTNKAVEGLPNRTQLVNSVKLFDSNESLSKILNTLLSNPVERARMRNSAVEYIRNYQALADQTLMKILI